MFPVGGIAVMLAGAIVSGLVCALLAFMLRRRMGPLAASTLGLLLWSVVVIGLVTLLPTNWDPGIVPAESRTGTCSWDVGGPAPDGFWVFGGGQRLLNTLIFVPSGFLLVLTAMRWRWAAIVLVPVGLALLAAYSVGIEFTQLELARLDRACDATDIVDNTTGALVGGLIGGVISLIVHPWDWGKDDDPRI